MRDGEAIEFVTESHPEPVRLTKDTRRKLVLASTCVKELTEETSIRGVIPEADQDDLTFEIQLTSGHKVSAPMPPQHMDTILQAFSGYRSGTRVFVQGIGRFNRTNRLLKFESIEYISILDPLDIPARLDEFHQLKDDWLDGYGLAPSHEGLTWLAEAFQQYYPDELPLPYLYPTEEGGIQAEWPLDDTEVSIEIDLKTQTGQWHALNLATREDEAQELHLGEASGWQWLIGRIQTLSGGAA